MGALTDIRKRCLLDLCIPSSSPSHLQPDPSADGPLLKKLKTSSPLPIPSKPQQQGQVQSKPCRFPQLAPLPRPVHGPQRILKAFGLGSSNSCRRSPPEQVGGKELGTAMGNYVSRFLKKTASGSIWSQEKGKALAEHDRDRGSDDGSPEGLQLEDYKRLVAGVQEGHSVVTDQRSAEVLSSRVKFMRPRSALVSDLTILTRKDEDMPDLRVLNRKVENARRMVKVDSTPVREEAMWTKKSPVYKDLLETTSREYDYRLSRLEFEVRLTEKKVAEFRIASEKKPKEDLLGLFTPLTDKEENDVELALQDPNRSCLRWSQVLVTHESSNIEITREIMQCLRQGAWLNDEVINLYLELLKEREIRISKKYLKCHFFNTFFYKKLISGGDGYDFKAVRRWTSQRKIGYGLIECDKIFVPVHKEVHWCLAVINIKDEKFQYLDSLGGMDGEALRVLARYIVDEAKDKSNRIIDVRSWKHESVVDLPMQRNGWDCGMFMLKYVDLYSKGSSLCFGQEHMNYFRKRTAKEILSLRAD